LEILAGHGRTPAALLIAMKQVPIVRLSDLSPAERKAYVLADNKLALNGGWDREVLAIELQKLIDLGFDIEATGFALGEIEVILDEAAEGAPNYPLDGPRKMKFPSYATQQSQRRCVTGGGVTGWSAAMLATKRRMRRFSAMSAPT
jgi:ParB-like chromosome segregation protein Spo0J